MKSPLNQSVLDGLVGGLAAKKNIFGAVFHVSCADGGIDLISASGGMKPDDPYYIASINKFIVSAVVLKLCDENRLRLRDKIAPFFPAGGINGLHVYQGKDYSGDITIQHLLSLTSGLPCYLVDRQADGKVAMKELEAGQDQPWPIDRVIEAVKQMKPHFPPSEKGRAYCNDTGHQLLGAVLEKITGRPVSQALNGLFSELGMNSTYVCERVTPEEFAPLYYRSKKIQIPNFMNSTQNDMISTARDLMVFLKAFFNGYFYPKEKLPSLQQWNPIFFPFQYGIGIQKFYTPSWLSPFRAVPEMIGHCGSTGSVAYYVPQKDVYVTGTINQQAAPGIAFQTLARILQDL